MKVRFNKWYNALLTALLTMLGYSCSMDEPDEYGSIRMEYGVPRARFEVKGTVRDEGGKPVEGIKTSVKHVYHDEDNVAHTYGLDSVMTDASGRYAANFYTMPHDNSVFLIVEDLDGEANGGAFKSDTIAVDMSNAKQTAKGEGGWDQGTYSIEQDIQLKKKQ